MYMGVILPVVLSCCLSLCAPHVYGGDPVLPVRLCVIRSVLPMYMGVILQATTGAATTTGAPHVYGGDPVDDVRICQTILCSPCIWG